MPEPKKLVLSPRERCEFNPTLWCAVFAAQMAKWNAGQVTEENVVEFDACLRRAEEWADLIVWRSLSVAPRPK